MKKLNGLYIDRLKQQRWIQKWFRFIT